MIGKKKLNLNIHRSLLHLQPRRSYAIAGIPDPSSHKKINDYYDPTRISLWYPSSSRDPAALLLLLLYTTAVYRYMYDHRDPSRDHTD